VLELLNIKLDDESPSELELNSTSEELLGGTLELLLCVVLDEDTAEELETTDELLDNEPPSELELHPTGGGGISRSDEQEKSSEVQSTAARVIGQGKRFFIICSPF